MPGGRGQRGRGGYQPPAQPAPVSGPGALAARTDTPATQPIRVASGGDFGARQAMVGLQHAAPLAAGGPPPAAAPAPGQPSAIPSPQPGSLTPLTAPTSRPAEPITAGLSVGPGPAPSTPDGSVAMMLRQAADASGSSSLHALADLAEQMGQ
jgi:hypothetical protein